MKDRKRIWVPDLEEQPKMVVELPPIKIQGIYYIDLIDSESGEIKQHLEFENLITDDGLDLIGTGTSLDSALTTLAVGSGGSTPSTSDTALDNEVDSTTSDGGYSDVDTVETSPEEYSSRKRTRVFTESEAVADLRELGWKGGGVLVNRTLFKDAEGVPTVVEKSDRDILRIVYEYRIFAPLEDVTGTQNFSGSNTVDYRIRPQRVNSSPGWLGLLDNMGNYASALAYAHETKQLTDRYSSNNPSPSELYSSKTLETYTAGSFYRDMVFKWTYSDGNFASGIGLITWNLWPGAGGTTRIWQMYCSQSIDKTEDNRLDITFRQRWTRK